MYVGQQNNSLSVLVPSSGCELCYIFTIYRQEVTIFHSLFLPRFSTVVVLAVIQRDPGSGTKVSKNEARDANISKHC